MIQIEILKRQSVLDLEIGILDLLRIYTISSLLGRETLPLHEKKNCHCETRVASRGNLTQADSSPLRLIEGVEKHVT